jgi:hypothetical protein
MKRTGKKMCNHWHLGGRCENGNFCQFQHEPKLTTAELNALRYKTRSLACKDRYCENIDCCKSNDTCKNGPVETHNRSPLLRTLHFTRVFVDSANGIQILDINALSNAILANASILTAAIFDLLTAWTRPSIVGGTKMGTRNLLFERITVDLKHLNRDSSYRIEIEAQHVCIVESRGPQIVTTAVISEFLSKWVYLLDMMLRKHVIHDGCIVRSLLSRYVSYSSITRIFGLIHFSSPIEITSKEL